MISYLPWGITIASIIGTMANAYRKRWGFVVWLCTNLSWCAYDLYHHIYAQSFLFGVYAVLAVIGWISWGKAEKRG